MAARATELVAGIIDRIEDRSLGTGRPPMPTIKVIETLRFFVRESVQWRELRAEAGRACGSTLRRRLDAWSATAVLRRVSMSSWSGWSVRDLRSPPGTWWWTVVRSAPSAVARDRKSTRLNSSHANISYAVFCLKKKT